MTLLKVIIIILLLTLSLYLIKGFKLNRHKKVFKSKEILIFNKINLKKWMNLTKKERYDLSKKESINYLDKRRILLEEIRKEYKKIPKSDFKKP